MGRYLEWLVGYQFPSLTQFFARVEDLVVTVGAADVTYHEPRRNLESTLKKQGDMKVGGPAVHYVAKCRCGVRIESVSSMLRLCSCCLDRNPDLVP